jgi:hypothetical protein
MILIWIYLLIGVLVMLLFPLTKKNFHLYHPFALALFWPAYVPHVLRHLSIMVFACFTLEVASAILSWLSNQFDLICELYGVSRKKK